MFLSPQSPHSLPKHATTFPYPALRMGPSPHSKSCRRSLVLLPVTLLLLYWLTLWSHAGDRAHAQLRLFNEATTPWWSTFFDALEAARPEADPIFLDETIKPPFENWKPVNDRARPSLLNLTESTVAALRDAHSTFLSSLPSLSASLPYERSTTGIVTTTGLNQFGQVVTLLLMLRQTGSKLPVQVVLDTSPSPWISTMCLDSLPSLGATCLFLPAAWHGITPPPPRFERFQWKVLSIIASSFQNVLFLDADALPVLNPDSIFTPGSQPFTSTGFITWPDFWTPSASPDFFTIAGGVEIPPLTARTSSESGVMVIDKSRHADTLLLSGYYNYFGPDYYYLMMTQHGPGEGDKEVYLAAAMVLDDLTRRGTYTPPTDWIGDGTTHLRKGYWDVKAMPRVWGRTVAGNWRGMFMQQMCPMEDYRAVMEAIENEGLPPKEHRRNEHVDDYFTDSSFLARTGNLTIEHQLGRTMFFHHNGVKLDFTSITDPGSGIISQEKNGDYARLWGEPGWIVENTGRDVEKVLWEDAMRFWCRQHGFKRACESMREVYDAVYAGLYS